MTPRLTDLEITPGMLAEQKGWNRQKAWRELQRIEQARPGTLRRQGRRVFALASEIAPFIKGREPTALERSVNQLRVSFAELSRRLDVGLSDVLERLRNLERTNGTGRR
jgi:hypothetical protein